MSFYLNIDVLEFIDAPARKRFYTGQPIHRLHKRGWLRHVNTAHQVNQLNFGRLLTRAGVMFPHIDYTNMTECWVTDAALWESREPKVLEILVEQMFTSGLELPPGCLRVNRFRGVGNSLIKAYLAGRHEAYTTSYGPDQLLRAG